MEEASSASEDTIKEIMNLLKDPKIEVRKGTLMLILQFSTTSENRLSFQNTDLIKQLFRFTTEPSIATTSLSNLINFTQDELYCQKAFEINAIKRLIELVKETALASEKSKNENSGLVIELTLLTLSNLCQLETGVRQFLGLDEEEFKGLNLKILTEFFRQKEWETPFNFFGNILANVSSIPQGRAILIEKGFDIIKKILPSLFSENRERRIGTLRTLRNCIFEYEAEGLKEQILEESLDLVNVFTKFIARVLVNSDILKEASQREQIHKACSSNPLLKGDPLIGLKDPVKGQNDLGDLVLAIDVLLVLTNIEDFEKKFKFDPELIELFMILVKPLLPEEIKDKVDVILCFYCKLNTFEGK